MSFLLYFITKLAHGSAQFIVNSRCLIRWFFQTPDNRFEVFVDSVLVNKGSLLTDMTPPVNPPEEIEDPNDKKPADWDERERIPDVTASKPEDWDEDAPAKIPDPSAVKPDGWLDTEPVRKLKNALAFFLL